MTNIADREQVQQYSKD